MKKILATLACGVVFASAVSADALRIEGGAGMWQQKSSGDASYTETGYNGEYKSDENTNNKGYIWLMIKHPVPILPNLRVEYVSVEDEGDVSGRFKNYAVTGVAKGELTMDQYDIVPSGAGNRDNYGPVIVPPHHYFMMGDNRDNSLDSRYWGFLPEENIVGEALILYFSWNKNAPLYRFYKKIRWSRIGHLIK
jgi:hypothetical protein